MFGRIGSPNILQFDIGTVDHMHITVSAWRPVQQTQGIIIRGIDSRLNQFLQNIGLLLRITGEESWRR